MTQAQLKELLHYDPETGKFTWLVAANTQTKAGDEAGTLSYQGYIRIGLLKKLRMAHRLAWLYMTGSFPADTLDHINGVKNDNRFCNLREATKSQNQANRGRQKNNTSGFKGVSWHTGKKKWHAIIIRDRNRKSLGYFNDAIEAKKAYDKAAVELFGEFARL